MGRFWFAVWMLLAPPVFVQAQNVAEIRQPLLRTFAEIT